ncbi:hypothetical protein CLAIMM_05086 [Cladophialophora immunda]|nr:hypothetical protein CLAIMM_05086 [Cladophialophora immunda]
MTGRDTDWSRERSVEELAAWDPWRAGRVVILVAGSENERPAVGSGEWQRPKHGGATDNFDRGVAGSEAAPREGHRVCVSVRVGWSTARCDWRRQGLEWASESESTQRPQ